MEAGQPMWSFMQQRWYTSPYTAACASGKVSVDEYLQCFYCNF